MKRLYGRKLLDRLFLQQSVPHITRICIIIAMLFMAVAAHSNELAEETFQLNSSDSLKVIEQENLSTSVEINVYKQVYKLVTIENAAISKVQKIKLCEGCKESYFISLYDRSSTYGSTTGIVAWQNRSGNWSLMTLPFRVAGVVDDNKDGVFKLVDWYSEKTENKFNPVKMKYTFKDGLICPE
jgi:hypothetical protein